MTQRHAPVILPREVEDRLVALIQGRVNGKLVVFVFGGKVVKAEVTEQLEWQR